MKEKKHNDPKTTGDDLSDRRQDRRNSVQNFLDSVVRKSALVFDPNDLYKEDHNEEIIALRGWNLAVNGNNSYFLQSPSRGISPWPKRRPFKSECISNSLQHGANLFKRGLTRRRRSSRFSHDSPHVGCWCGVYGLKSGVLEALGDIAGEVYIFGDYIEHELGFRGQYAYPKSLRWFRCSNCEEICRMNDLLIARSSPNESQSSTAVSNVYQMCKPCLGGHQYGNRIDLIPLSYVIEKLEYEYQLEVYR